MSTSRSDLHTLAGRLADESLDIGTIMERESESWLALESAARRKLGNLSRDEQIALHRRLWEALDGELQADLQRHSSALELGTTVMVDAAFALGLPLSRDGCTTRRTLTERR